MLRKVAGFGGITSSPLRWSHPVAKKGLFTKSFLSIQIEFERVSPNIDHGKITPDSERLHTNPLLPASIGLWNHCRLEPLPPGTIAAWNHCRLESPLLGITAPRNLSSNNRADSPSLLIQPTGAERRSIDQGLKLRTWGSLAMINVTGA